MEYFAKLHRKGHVLAACDGELLGKSFSGGKFKLSVKEEFYSDGKPVSKEELERLMGSAEILNLVGSGTIQVAKGLGIDIDAILKVGAVPHVQILKVKPDNGKS